MCLTKPLKLLKKHIEFEHEGKRFKCDICEQGFRRKHTLKEHKASKHEDGNFQVFKCDICDHKTKSSSGLRQHIQNAHKG